MRILALFLISFLLLSGCASESGWRPTVDSYNNANAANIDRDLVECRQLAKQASGDTATETGKGALIGGAIGAAAGAVLGAAVGAPGKGAAIGAAAGGMGGGAKQGFGAEDQFKKSYINCMRNRGHQVVN